MHQTHHRSGSTSPQRERRKPSKKLLKDVLELEGYKTKDGKMKYTIRPVEETLTFDKGFYVFIRALQLLKAQNDGVILVGLGGASGSGKTAFSEKIKGLMPGVVLISMDMYNDGSKVVDQNFDDPRLTDYDCLLANLADLKAGKETKVPIYDFKSSKRVGYNCVSVPNSRVIILEGIYALSDKIRPLLDLRVSITGGVHFDLVKRVMRDITRAGQGPEAVVQQVTETVYPMFKAFIEPDLQTAQLKIFNSFNPFSGFMHPTYILKSQRVPNVELIRAQLQAHGALTEQQEKELADIYLLPPGEDPETCQSWLRMRNKEGRYSLMFEEWVIEDPFIISPRITFEVNVKILGGLMALGYEIGTIMKRTSHIFKLSDVDLTVKVDEVQGLGQFVQLLGRERDLVASVGRELGLEHSYIPRSYIEQVQLEKLTTDFTAVSAEMRDKLTSTQGSSSQILDEILNASPPARMPRRARRTSEQDPDEGLDMDDDLPLSSSAPVKTGIHGLMHIRPGVAAGNTVDHASSRATNGSASSSSTSPSEPSALSSRLNGSFGTPRSRNNGAMHRPPSGLLHHQLSSQTSNVSGNARQSPGPQALTHRLSGFVASPSMNIHNSNSFGRSGTCETPSRRPASTLPCGAAPNEVLSNLTPIAADDSTINHPVIVGGFGKPDNGGVADARVTQLSRAVGNLDTQLQQISTSVEKYSSMQDQLQALVQQQQQTSQAILQLSQVTTSLAANLEATMSALATRQQAVQPSNGSGSTWGASQVGSDHSSRTLLQSVVLPAGVAVVTGCAVTAAILYFTSKGRTR